MAASLTPLPLSPGHTPVNILLVDDQPGRLLTYRAILEPLGERLVDASSGPEALQKLMQDEFAVILLDVNMPGMDGFETASLIHQHPRFERTPIIFVTAVNVSDLDRMRGYKLGAVDYVMVPVIPEILRSKVVVLAELFRKRRELQLANERLAAANEALRTEKARELEMLNESLRLANVELAQRNVDLQSQIGERVRAEMQLRELDRRKDEFLATLAHELRNPLAPLRNAVSIRKLTGSDDPFQDMMERQLGLLVRLIDDLLDVARISRGKLVLKPEPTTLQQILHAAIETASPVLEAGAHPLQLALPEMPLPMLADGERLSQVFSNLLSNAAKYSDAGRAIELVAHRDGQFVTVSVHDRGIGLTPQQIEEVFELFAQVDTSIERARGGLGIGLTLVKQLVEMHGGSIRCESPGLGHGSVFIVTLPLRETVVEPAHAPAVAPPARQASGRARRILVLDDNRDAADTLAMMLEILGHEVTRLYDPHEAGAEVQRFDPDLVFLDIGMPSLSGYELARQLRAQPGGDRRVLVAVTGWGQPDDRRRTAEAGFDHHLVKPPDLDIVRSICDESVSRVV
ncbi:Atypical hybrid histidine kinase [Lysobacter dokdonensis DS-58]|uniref:histidine kinase n=1 Tax=Lysobacter dokdonensis DS-58 TaxID=1300345 RepID=A0A0A2WDC3_9GAMM|nr:response regulator [Lysobacter dokdonensis]KGQ18196.1 Atypical hybrid histidine kinase [Lysobacter dokdonensis DS-58]